MTVYQLNLNPGEAWLLLELANTGIDLAGGTEDEIAEGLAQVYRLDKEYPEARVALGNKMQALADILKRG